MLDLFRRLIGIISVRALSVREGDIIVVKGSSANAAINFGNELGNSTLASYPIPILCTSGDVDIELLRNMPADFKDNLREKLNA
jgi:hypothetical protein